ncbi:hypothetical protein Pcinc_025787 [Petrolisthes cinctipes]|uniref:Uncharacterized protein n=1 Tax=Petrolisthes cinctipes TaxID=88211 RepID=A0AAE1F856_PETCI|nr:hypothetical protein Pcinc_025787 [Petrolisthes cinctipes]
MGSTVFIYHYDAASCQTGVEQWTEFELEYKLIKEELTGGAVDWSVSPSGVTLLAALPCLFTHTPPLPRSPFLPPTPRFLFASYRPLPFPPPNTHIHTPETLDRLHAGVHSCIP